jgi:hypothetical protein
VSAYVTGEPEAVAITRAADSAAIVSLAVETRPAAVELVFAIGKALDAIPAFGITERGRRERHAVLVGAAHGRRRRRRRPGVSSIHTVLVRDELVVFDAAGLDEGERYAEQKRDERFRDRSSADPLLPEHASL